MARSWSLTGTQMVPTLLMRVAVLLTTSSWVVADDTPVVTGAGGETHRPCREGSAGFDSPMSGADEVPELPRRRIAMTKVTCDMAMSVDGFTSGPNQSADKPFGDGPVDRLTQWMFEQSEANAAEIEAIVAAGAFIMGRNMFGPDRGEWDESWTGWWGDEPPYHAPVFVLAHRPREPLQMQGGTTFTFVTDGIHSALEQAREAAGSGDVAIAGGASTVNQ